MPAPKGPRKNKEWRKKIGDVRRGKHLSEETRKKVSEARKGMRFSEEHRKNLSISHKNPSEETRKKMGAANKGRRLSEIARRAISERNRNPSEETRKKISNAHKGKRLSEETRKKMSEYAKNRPEEHRKKSSNTLKGHTVSKETRKKMSESRKGKYCLDKCYQWRGGRSSLPYCFKFNKRRRKAVRIFFGYFCICCGKHVTENIVKRWGQVEHSVHHIDHDKEQGCNGKPFNLVPLCAECHAKELHHEQGYKNYINKTLEEGFKWGIWSREQYELEVMYPEIIGVIYNLQNESKMMVYT